MPTTAKTPGMMTAFEAKTRFGTLLRRVAAGEEIIITRHDMPVARIVPQDQDKDRRDRARLAMEGLQKLRQQIMARPDYVEPTDEDIREGIAWGRK